MVALEYYSPSWAVSRSLLMAFAQAFIFLSLIQACCFALSRKLRLARNGRSHMAKFSARVMATYSTPVENDASAVCFWLQGGDIERRGRLFYYLELGLVVTRSICKDWENVWSFWLFFVGLRGIIRPPIIHDGTCAQRLSEKDWATWNRKLWWIKTRSPRSPIIYVEMLLPLQTPS